MLRWEWASQMLSLATGRQFLTHVAPRVIRPLRIIWNQIIGLVFLLLTASAVPRTFRSIREFHGDAEGLFRVLLSVIFVTIMAAFCLYSFWRAHKVPRSR